jgi:hypothetical protein
MKTASMMILPYLVLAFTGLPAFASASDGEDPAAASLLQRGEDIVISGGNRVIGRKLESSKSVKSYKRGRKLKSSKSVKSRKSSKDFSGS